MIVSVFAIVSAIGFVFRVVFCALVGELVSAPVAAALLLLLQQPLQRETLATHSPSPPSHPTTYTHTHTHTHIHKHEHYATALANMIDCLNINK